MYKPAVIMATSNGVGAGHLIRTSAIARELLPYARPIIFSMANSALEVSEALGLEHEYVPGRDKGWMPRWRWDRYLRDRLISLIDETDARVITFDGVVPYPGILAAKFRRPKVSLIWIRRGMWRSQPQGMALNLQSKLMDYIIEPGDIARDYDSGPTRNREDAVLTSPVTHHSAKNSFNHLEAKKSLKLNPKKRCVLVQLGVGESDMNDRVSTILEILSRFSNLQVVMVREPKNQDGINLAPPGLDLKIVRYFPMVDVLAAFDGIICASGYNSVHEVIPARIPTLFIPNSRGTDDQRARARWCVESGLALMVDDTNWRDIEIMIERLLNPSVRKVLRKNCSYIKPMTGGREIAEIIRILLNENVTSLVLKRIRHKRILAQSSFERGLSDLIRKCMSHLLRTASIIFRFLFPHHPFRKNVTSSPVVFASSKIRSNKSLKRGYRLEHVLMGSSDIYLSSRKKIAQSAYQVSSLAFNIEVYRGREGSISLNSSTRSA